MFKLFNNNLSNKKQTEDISANQYALIQRWDAFLQKVELRFNETIDNSLEFLSNQLTETDYDYDTVFRTWQAIKPKLFTLLDSIESTFNTKVKPLMKAEGDFWHEQERKGLQFRDYLHSQLSRQELILEGKLSQQFYDHAIQIANQDFNCTQCNSKLQIKKGVFRAQYITCKSCNSTNTFEPEHKFIQLGWNIIDNIAALESLTQYDAMQNTLNAIQSQRPPVAENLWNIYKTHYLNYYETYYKKRIQLRPELQERYETDIQQVKHNYNEYEKAHKKTH